MAWFEKLYKVLQLVTPSLLETRAKVPYVTSYIMANTLGVTSKLLPPILLTTLYQSSDELFESVEDRDASIYLVASVFLAAMIGDGILPPLRRRMLTTVESRAGINILEALIRKCFVLELDQHLATPTGEFCQLLGQSHMAAQDFLPGFLDGLLPSLMEASGLLVLLLYLSPVLGGAVIALILVNSYFSLKDSIHNKNIMDTLMRLGMQFWGQLLATLERYEIAHYFDNTNTEIAKIRSKSESLNNLMSKDRNFQLWIQVRQGFLQNTGVSAIAVLAAYYYLNHLMSLEKLAASVYCVMLLLISFLKLSGSIDKTYKGVISYQPIIAFLSSPPPLFLIKKRLFL